MSSRVYGEIIAVLLGKFFICLLLFIYLEQQIITFKFFGYKIKVIFSYIISKCYYEPTT